MSTDFTGSGSGGGLFNNWFSGKNKSVGSNSFQRRASSASSSSMGDSSFRHDVASNSDPLLRALHRTTSSSAPLPTLLSQHTAPDAELTSKVRLILYTELKQIISEFQLARHILVPPSASDGGRVENSHHPSCDKQQQQQLLLIKDLEMQLNESMQKQCKLQEEVEVVKPKKFEFNSGSFTDGAPSPPMLQDAQNSMHNALLACAVKVNEQTKASLRIMSTKSTFVHQLCNCFFIDFEATSFGVSQRNPQISTFERPDKDLKHRLFKYYMDYKTENESGLWAVEMPFRSFCASRFQHLIYNNVYESTPFTSPDQRKSVLSQLLSEKGPLFVDFLRLAKTVWLLHKLAFAFEPTAEIFRVNEGSHYDAEYMEASDGDTESVKEGGVAEVHFMAAPGFTVRNFVIKAQVHLKRKEA